MHFALPPRKTSFPPPYARVSAQNASSQRRKQVQYLAYVIFGLLTIYLLVGLFSNTALPAQHGPIREDATVLIATVLDESRMSSEYITMVKNNRDDYASRHGYKTLYTNISTYNHLTKPAPASWSLLPALRNALTQHPQIDYIWSLAPDAVITNPALSLHDHIFSQLSDLMRKDIPVVPPDSVIHTFSHLKPTQAYLILTQDTDNVAHTSFILRNSDTIPVGSNQPKDNWSQYFLDAWFDPLYRAYAFQKAENHALEHIIQWHPTLLAKLAIVDQRMLNSYSPESVEQRGEAGAASAYGVEWKAGDLVVNLKGCAVTTGRDCTREMKQYFKIWKETVERLDGKSDLH